MFKKICGVLSTLILIVLLLLAILMVGPFVFGLRSMAVLTGSMEPNYPVGSMVYVKEAPMDSIEVDDVISYRISSDTVVTHRVVAVDRDLKQFTTKGDANATEDGAPVSYDNVVGKARLVIPYLGFISIYAKTPIGIAVICGVLILIILLTFLPEIFSPDSEDDDKTKGKRRR